MIHTTSTKLFLTATLAALAGAFVIGSTQAKAQSGQYPFPTLVERIAKRFSLNPSDVQSVFDEARQDRLAWHHAQLADRLSELVRNGQLTQAQKQIILDKLSTLQREHEANLETWRSLTPQERKENSRKTREEFRSWASENGIDLSLLFSPFHGHGMVMGMGHMRGW